jgi:hypothetical protein
MMKKLILISLIINLISFVNVNANQITIDTLKWANGNIRIIESCDFNNKSIYQKHFDTLGKKSFEGLISYSDSIKSIHLINETLIFKYVFRSDLIIIYDTSLVVFKIGEWKYYNSEGLMTHTINYIPIVQSYEERNCEEFSKSTYLMHKPCSGSMTMMPMFNKITFYDSNSEIIREEKYLYGFLVNVTNYSTAAARRKNK